MPKKPPKPVRRFSLKPAVAAFGTCALAAFGYWVLVWVGEQASHAVAERPRYRVKLDEIQCAAPPGLERVAFLAEVRYLAKLPGEFSSIQLPPLAQAFAKHPWVKNAILAPWPQGVELEFRKPYLAIATPQGERVVDDGGILLPAGASPAGLPKFLTVQPLPNMNAGELWKSRDVLRAVELVSERHATVIERQAGGWKIRDGNNQMLTLTQ